MNEETKIRSGAPMHSGNMMSDSRGGSKLPWVVLLVVVVVIIIVAVLFRDKWGGKDAESMKRSEYQAVFLTNGQVYFGKLSNPRDSYVKLSDIYYLQVIQPNLQGSQEQQQQAQQQQPQISLVKLGNELHGPVDEMHISRDQILFYEDMKDDGKVMQAIKDHKANPNGTGQQTPPPAAAPAPTQQQQATPPAAPAPAPAPAPATNSNNQR